MAGISKKDVRSIIRAAASQGCKVVERKNGVILRHPDGKTTICVHWTTSDHRVMANVRADFLRARLTWPFD